RPSHLLELVDGCAIGGGNTVVVSTGSKNAEDHDETRTNHRAPLFKKTTEELQDEETHPELQQHESLVPAEGPALSTMSLQMMNAKSSGGARPHKARPGATLIRML
ncbi:unnamed protein product, partial [Amoebophrya sp. A120]